MRMVIHRFIIIGCSPQHTCCKIIPNVLLPFVDGGTALFAASMHSFSVYVNRPGLSFGYFFRGGGTLSGIQRGIVEFTVEGYNERAFISMNQQQVQQLEIDDGNTIQVVDIDRNKPFAIVLPINAGNITFYDVNRNTVEYWNNPL